MTTRFTETEKWKDPWFRQQPPAAKCLWEYMRDNCDAAGIIELDVEAACFHTGLKRKDLEAALKHLERGYVAASGHLMLRTFLKHQKNIPFNENNPAHKGILRRLAEASEIFPDALSELNDRGVLSIQEGAYKELLSSIGIGTGKGNGKGAGKGKLQEGSAAFEAFYAVYPRREARQDAIKAWGQVGAEGIADVIMAALEWQAPEMKESERKHRPLPASWLRGRRWEDEKPDDGMNRSFFDG